MNKKTMVHLFESPYWMQKPRKIAFQKIRLLRREGEKIAHNLWALCFVFSSSSKEYFFLIEIECLVHAGQPCLWFMMILCHWSCEEASDNSFILRKRRAAHSQSHTLPCYIFNHRRRESFNLTYTFIYSTYMTFEQKTFLFWLERCTLFEHILCTAHQNSRNTVSRRHTAQPFSFSQIALVISQFSTA